MAINTGDLSGSMKMLLLCEHQRRPFLASRSNLVRVSLVLSRALRSDCRITRALGSSRETPCVPAAGTTNQMIGTGEIKIQKEQQNHLQLGIFEKSKVHETHAQTSFQAPKDLPTHP